MLCIGQQQVDPRQQKIIALILIAVGGLHRMGSIFAPLVLCGGVLAYHTQLAIQNANAPGYRDHLAGGGIVPGCQKGGFAAGHLQAAALHILHPCRSPALANRELHRRFHRLPVLGQLHRELPGALPCPQPTEPVGVRRIGILDRKLRVVSENAATEDEWRKYATHAVQSTYGYEYQGDNLLLARVNLLLTYAEHLQARWQCKPAKEELQAIATIISLNLLQMDGLHLSVPGGKPQPETEQLDLFSMFGAAEPQPPTVSCKVKNWRKGSHGTTQNFEIIQEGSTSMKFDYVIGNPPYQISDGGAGVSATPIYNRFIEAIKTTHPGAICLIIPAKWYSGGKGLDKFREEMLGDRHISTLVDYSNSLDVFPNVDVAGGVCYFVWKESYNGKCKYTNYRNGKATTAYRDLNEFQTFIRYPVASEIVKKVKEDGELTLDKVISSRKPFGLATTAKPMKTGDITLRYNGGRGPYKRTEIRVGAEMIDQWKIIISRLTAEHAGQPAKDGKYRVLSTMELLKPGEICSETYLVAGAFDSKEEATNYMDYLKTQFVRFLILQIAMTQQLSKASFAFVPCQDFTRKWTDKQLFEKYDLSSEEVNYIQGMIKEMA